MTNKVFLILFSGLALIVQSVSVSAMDVKPKAANSLSYLEVKTSLIEGESFVGFVYHRYPNDAGVIVGPKKFYRLTEVQKQRGTENWDILQSTLADVGVIVVGAFGGAAIESGIAALAGASGGAYIPLIGFGAGATLGTYLDHAIDALNPFEQYDQAQTISEDVIQDRDVILKSDKDIKQFVDRLSVVLSNMES